MLSCAHHELELSMVMNDIGTQTLQTPLSAHHRPSGDRMTVGGAPEADWGIFASGAAHYSITARPVAALSCAASPIRTAAMPSSSVTSGAPSPCSTALNR